ncbi:MAG: hypothetical protein M3360_10520 [Actinomycetota bacterium]|nr:hypothetical protein [Actinomycetota bacterium]
MVTPTGGRVGTLRLLHTVARLEGTAATEGTETQYSLSRALQRAAKIARTRGTIWIVSDWRSQADWRRPLGRLVHRHEVVAVEIQDPREQELPNVGDLWLMDPETGRQMRVDTGDRKLRRDFAAAAAAERAGLRRELLATGAHHVVLTTSEGLAAHAGRSPLPGATVSLEDPLPNLYQPCVLVGSERRRLSSHGLSQQGRWRPK